MKSDLLVTSNPEHHRRKPFPPDHCSSSIHQTESQCCAHIRNCDSFCICHVYHSSGTSITVRGRDGTHRHGTQGKQKQLLLRHRDISTQSTSRVPRQGWGGTTAPLSLSKKIMSLLLQCLFHRHVGTSLFYRLLWGNHNLKWFWTSNVTIQKVRCGRQMPHLLDMFSRQHLCKQHWRSWFSYPTFTKGLRFALNHHTLYWGDIQNTSMNSSGCSTSTAQTSAQNKDPPSPTLNSAALTWRSPYKATTCASCFELVCR